MIYKNVELYNVVELEPAEIGYHMLRVPNYVRQALNTAGKTTARDCTGVELRFKLPEGCDSVKITLNMPDSEDACCAWVYYGAFQAGWQETEKYIYNHPTEIVLKRQTDNHELLKRIEKEKHLPYNTDLIRLVLPGCNIDLVDIDGPCLPPEPSDAPQKRYLAYGSSITHGSLSLSMPSAYAERTARRMKMDVLNLGFSGSAHIENAMADYIASRQDWDIATLELGINIADAISKDEFYARSKYFIQTVAEAHMQKPIICTDAFTSVFDIGSKEEYWFRDVIAEICAEINLPNLHYVNGRELMEGYDTLSADLAHPSVDGQEEISNNLIAIMRELI